jgi:phosphatidylserine/phosphatidylglycerophosphate/cardiolipin synthase-like enzyme
MKSALACLLLCSCSSLCPQSAPDSGAADSGVEAEAGPSTPMADLSQVGPETARKWTVFFSPKGGCTQAVVDLVGSAQSEVLVQAYSFTSKPIADALVAKAAKRDGGPAVTVNVIADRSDAGTPGLAMLTGAAGMVPTWVDSKHAIAHNKVLIVDEKVVETGSFNYTQQAETSNAENCLIVRDAGLAKAYADNWRAHQAHSVPVQEPTP